MKRLPFSSPRKNGVKSKGQWKVEMRTEREIERDMLNSMNSITEALYRHGFMTDQDAQEAQDLRTEVGAMPLRLQRDTFDSSVITPTLAIPPEHIREIRELVGASQSVLARHLGVATATVSQWERGARKPDGPALRLLSLIERHGLGYVR
jgi:putative transcriptional regulator